MLLIGVYEHGLGSWDKIIADAKLNLADKVGYCDIVCFCEVCYCELLNNRHPVN